MRSFARLMTVLSILALFAILTLTPAPIAKAQDAAWQSFPQTGHWVTGAFLAKYLSVKNPELVFGLPITDEFLNPTTDVMVQYFERAVFELHPEKPVELRVTLKNVGVKLYVPGPSLPIPKNFPACQYFSVTGHQVCYDFLDFFNAHGGVEILGYPISDIEFQNNYQVQWFSNACLEFDPSLPLGKQITLKDLGRKDFENLGLNPELLLPRDPPAGDPLPNPQVVLKLQVRAFVEEAVLPPRGTQTVYIIVQDQTLRAVSNAQVTLDIRYNSSLPPNPDLLQPKWTDENGIVRFTLPVSSAANGIVEIFVAVDYGSLRQQTRTSFRIWY